MLLFLHNLLIVSTVINVERLFSLLGTVPSSGTESTEKRLVAADELLRVRLCASLLLSVEDEDCAGSSASQYVDNRPPGLDEKRPKGSGERGIMGESVGIEGEENPK